jgi:STAS domain.
VETWPHLLLLRVDESITFANINYIEEFINAELRRQPNLKHIVLIFTSISDIDTTAGGAGESEPYFASIENDPAYLGSERPGTR